VTLKRIKNSKRRRKAALSLRMTQRQTRRHSRRKSPKILVKALSLKIRPRMFWNNQRLGSNTPKKERNSEASVTLRELRWLASKADCPSPRNPSLLRGMLRIREVCQALRRRAWTQKNAKIWRRLSAKRRSSVAKKRRLNG
jgi:hypothetical protein